MNLYEALDGTTDEKSIEAIWHQAINGLKVNDESIHLITNASSEAKGRQLATDGFWKMSGGDIGLLLEIKKGFNLASPAGPKSASVALSQAAVYMSRFNTKGDRVRAISLADENELILVPALVLQKHVTDFANGLYGDITIAASNPPQSLIDAIANDEGIRTNIWSEEINGKRDAEKLGAFQTQLESIINAGNLVKIPFPSSGVALIDRFNEFLALTQHKGSIEIVDEHDEKRSLTVNEGVNFFIQIATGKIQPERLKATGHNVEYRVNYGGIGSLYAKPALANWLNRYDFSRTDESALTSIQDVLIADEIRRRKGEFYTPSIWVDEAHKEIAKAFGEDWKENYIVWDNSCGTANLTRDYQFKELYLSTIEDSDLDTIRKVGYNPEATVFHFDFLNDDFTKLPDGLRKAIEETPERIIVLMNPPYGTSKNGSSKVGDSKAGIAKTVCNERMLMSGWGKSSQQLYAQFFYRCHEIGTNIATFANQVYLSGSSFSAFREHFLQKYRHETGFMFNAGHFSDTKGTWAVGFNVWKRGVDDRTEWTLDVKDADKSGNITTLGQKIVYNLDGKNKMNVWNRVGQPKGPPIVSPSLSNFNTVCDDPKRNRGRLHEASFGYVQLAGNAVKFNGQFVSIYSAAFSNANGIEVLPQNFEVATSSFAARKLVVSSWTSECDEYLCPNESHSEYQRFLNDSVVYSLFNPASQQSSLRQVEYDGKVYDVKNEFFWLSRSEIEDLATKDSFKKLEEDAKDGEDRFVFQWLQSNEVSQTARKVVDIASDLVRLSLTGTGDDYSHRREVHRRHPEYHLNAWDAGYAQLKRVWDDQAKVDENFKARYNDFKLAYKQLAEELRPLVYELGFLRS